MHINRAKRRELDRLHDKSELYKQIEEIFNSEIEIIKKEILLKAVHDLTAAFIISLHDEMGFGKKRIEQVLARTNEQFDSIMKDFITIDDIKQWCSDNDINYEAVFNS